MIWWMQFLETYKHKYAQKYFVIIILAASVIIANTHTHTHTELYDRAESLKYTECSSSKRQQYHSINKCIKLPQQETTTITTVLQQIATAASSHTNNKNNKLIMAIIICFIAAH